MSNIGDLFSKWMLENKKEEVVSLIVEKLKDALDKPFYKWIQGNDYDSSGDVIKTDFRNKDKCDTVESLWKSYTGEKNASFCSSRGWNYITVEDEFYNEMNDKYHSIYLREYIDENFSLIKSLLPKVENLPHEDIVSFLFYEDFVGDSLSELIEIVYQFVESHYNDNLTFFFKEKHTM